MHTSARFAVSHDANSFPSQSLPDVRGHLACRSDIVNKVHLACAGLIAITLAAASACGRSDPAPDVTGQPPSIADSTTQIASQAAADSSPLFRTDSLTYTLQARDGGYFAPVEAVFTNRTGGPVYFLNCNGHTRMLVEQLNGGAWKEAWSHGADHCESPPITVEAGATRRFPAHLAVIQILPGEHPEIHDMPGTYRITWTQVLSSYRNQSPFGERLPRSQRVSNIFTLRAPKQAEGTR